MYQRNLPSRNKLHESLPQFWETSRAYFDAELAAEAEEFLLRGKVEHFVCKYKQALCLYVDLGDLATVLKASGTKVAAPIAILERLFKHSCTTQVLFKDQGVRKDMDSFLTSMKGKLQELENNDFLASDVEAYKTLCFKESSILATPPLTSSMTT